MSKCTTSEILVMPAKLAAPTEITKRVVHTFKEGKLACETGPPA